MRASTSTLAPPDHLRDGRRLRVMDVACVRNPIDPQPRQLCTTSLTTVRHSLERGKGLHGGKIQCSPTLWRLWHLHWDQDSETFPSLRYIYIHTMHKLCSTSYVKSVSACEVMTGRQVCVKTMWRQHTVTLYFLFWLLVSPLICILLFTIKRFLSPKKTRCTR